MYIEIYLNAGNNRKRVNWTQLETDQKMMSHGLWFSNMWQNVTPTRVLPETDIGSSSRLLEAKAVTQVWRLTWNPSRPPGGGARHSSSLRYELLPLEDFLAYKRIPLAHVSGTGEKKRTQEELKLRASVSVVAPLLR